MPDPTIILLKIGIQAMEEVILTAKVILRQGTIQDEEVDQGQDIEITYLMQGNIKRNADPDRTRGIRIINKIIIKRPRTRKNIHISTIDLKTIMSMNLKIIPKDILHIDIPKKKRKRKDPIVLGQEVKFNYRKRYSIP